MNEEIDNETKKLLWEDAQREGRRRAQRHLFMFASVAIYFAITIWISETIYRPLGFLLMLLPFSYFFVKTFQEYAKIETKWEYQSNLLKAQLEREEQ